MDEPGSIEIEILTLAQKGYSRVEFKRRVASAICRHFDCEGMDVYLREGDIDYTWFVRRESRESYSFGKAPEESEVTRNYRLMLNSDDDGVLVGHTDCNESRMIVPITIDARMTGLIAYFRKPEESFASENQEDYLAVSGIFAKAIFFRNTQSALHERIKELTCLYEITKIMHAPHSGIDETLHEVVKIVPQAFQFEESATSGIELDGKKYVSGIVSESSSSLKSNIVIAGSERGCIEVQYRTTGGGPDEKPFLIEEQNLLDGIAKQLSLLIEEQEAALEKSRLEDQLRHADRLATIGQLAAGVAHEINEPLANILGFAELIKKDPGLSRQTSSDIDKIIRASMFARETVKKLLVFAGKIQPGETEVNLNALVTEGIQFFDYRCRKNNIVVTARLYPRLPVIIADPGQIYQVFINLLVNSIQALPGGGEIQIQTSVEDGMMVLMIEDNGSGIPEDIQDKIFMPFFTTKGVGEGTGLGLVVVHGIVQAYRGSIEVESSIGAYTRFTLRLPLKDMNEK